MLENLKTWLLSLAESRVNTRNGKNGILRIYTSRTARMPFNGFSLDRLIEHCGVTRDVMCKAIGELSPAAGSGPNVHVVITTPERASADKREKRTQALNWRDDQIANRFAYFKAAGLSADSALPKFEANETVQ